MRDKDRGLIIGPLGGSIEGRGVFGDCYSDSSMPYIIKGVREVQGGKALNVSLVRA